MATVFLSYKQESPEHNQRVRDFADALGKAGKAHGVSVVLDQHFSEKYPAGPDEGWEIWSENEAFKADFILVVASRQYYDGYNLRHTPGTAPGIIPEVFIIRERIKIKSFVTGFIRNLVLHADDIEFVPLSLRRLQRFGPGDIAKVLAWIAGVAPANAPAAKWPSVLPPIDDWMVADCDDIRSAFAKLLSPDSLARILLIKGKGGLGKSTVTEELTAYPSRIVGGPLAARLDLKSGGDIHLLLDAFARKLRLSDTYTATETRAPDDRLAALFDALEKRSEPTVLVFDTFESRGALGNWIEKNVLPSAPSAPWLRVVIAGREVPDSVGTKPAEWRGVAEWHILKKLKWNDWSSLAKRLRPQLSGSDLKKVHEYACGNHHAIRAILGAAASAMDFNAQLELLRAAQGDPARLALATIDLLLAARPPGEQERVREALEATAVPHWFDEEIVGALLDISAADAVGRMVRLRELNVVESFRARGPGAMNVHQNVRAALRTRLAENNPDRLRALSARARTYFAGSREAPAVIEALYHRFTSEPVEAADNCRALFDEWDKAGRYASLLALRTILEELLDSSPWALSPGLARGTVLYYLGRIRYRYPRVDDRLGITEELARAALAQYQESEVASRLFQARNLLGDVLDRQGRLDPAISEYRAAIELAENAPSGRRAEIEHRFVAGAYDKISRILGERGDKREAAEALQRSRETRILDPPVAPADDFERDQFLSTAHNSAGDVFHKQRDLSRALASFRTSLGIRERLAARDPENANLQLDVAASHHRIGHVLRDQDDFHGAFAAYREGMAVMESLVNRYPSNAEWQKDFANSCARIAKALLRLPDGDRAEARRLIARGQATMELLARAHPLTQREQEVRDNLDRWAAQAGTEPADR